MATTDKFPAAQLGLLAICRLAEPIAITSILPYAWLMVISFDVGSKSTTCFYTGLLVASFSLAESISSIWWGKLADRVGRKPVLLVGCFGTMLSLLVVGFSSSFTVALFGRLLGGFLNGNIGIIQTMVGEIVRDPAHEPMAYSIMPFVWSLGTVMGPAIGGLLADPARSYPKMFLETGIFAHYPWALPNLVCASLMLTSIFLGLLFLQETHPKLCQQCAPSDQHMGTVSSQLLDKSEYSDARCNQYKSPFGTFNQCEGPSTSSQQQLYTSFPPLDAPQTQDQTPGDETPSWLTHRVAMLVLALGLFSYHSMCYDHLLPIFLQDTSSIHTDKAGSITSGLAGGLGLTTRTTGVILSIDGFIALFIQLGVFPLAVDKLGISRLLAVATVAHPVAYFVIPFLRIIPTSQRFGGILVCLVIRNLCSIVTYPVLLIMLKQASPSPSVLGRVNGLAASVGAACRTIAPPIAGLLYGWGDQIGFVGLAWWGACLVALMSLGQVYFVLYDSRKSGWRSSDRCGSETVA